MKQPGLKNSIKKGFERLNRSFERVIIGFRQEDIHLFRVEVKKIRALLRLAAADRGLKIPKKIHRFYHMAGEIRNLQLIQRRIQKDHFQDHYQNKQPENHFLSTVPEVYPAVIKEKIRQAIDLTRKMSKKKKPFLKGEQWLLKKLPETPGPPATRQFILMQMGRLEGVLLASFHNDENLHTLRKVLKDLLYTWPFIRKDAAVLLPAVLPGSRKYLRSLTQLLGNFQDRCTQLNFLESDPDKQGDLKRKWELEKENTRKEIQIRLLKGSC